MSRERIWRKSSETKRDQTTRQSINKPCDAVTVTVEKLIINIVATIMPDTTKLHTRIHSLGRTQDSKERSRVISNNDSEGQYRNDKQSTNEKDAENRLMEKA